MLNRRSVIVAVASLTLLAGCESVPSSYYRSGSPQVGLASWYGPAFDGKRTASGERFDMNTLTAAHRTLPLNSYARVTNLATGRSIVVRINDRGPYSPGRIIDLSARAARELGMKKHGVARVRVEPVSPREARI
jgi:rare lipoprotein A